MKIKESCDEKVEKPKPVSVYDLPIGTVFRSKNMHQYIYYVLSSSSIVAFAEGRIYNKDAFESREYEVLPDACLVTGKPSE